MVRHISASVAASTSIIVASWVWKIQVLFLRRLSILNMRRFVAIFAAAESFLHFLHLQEAEAAVTVNELH